MQTDDKLVVTVTVIFDHRKQLRLLWIFTFMLKNVTVRHPILKGFIYFYEESYNGQSKFHS